jgi:demethylmenaquinone methyltransferase/2-methoxy-6-polyprenyl-1,4-benzoquinol methylase
MKQPASLTSRRNKKYTLPSDKEKREYVKRNFDEISAGYDTFNDWITFGMHRLWKRKTARATAVSKVKNARILDLCTGSGDIAIMLHREFPEAEIYAIDFSQGMLNVLKKRLVAEKCNDSIKIKRGDISNLGFIKNNSVHAVTMGFGLRNVSSRERVLKEILRVLIPGGVYVNLDVGHVNIALFAFFHKLYFENIVPMIGSLLHGSRHEMYSYLPASARNYPDQIKLKKELEKTGFHEVNIKNFMFGAAAMHMAKKPIRKQ